MKDSGSEMLIVIADDDPDDIGLVIEALKDNNIKCKVIYVKNGLELLNLLLKKGDERMVGLHPDVIILDINMHVLDGLSALEKIKAHDELKHLPIYILSTTIRPDYLIRARELGAKNYYQKPPQFSELKNIIKEVCDDIR